MTFDWPHDGTLDDIQREAHLTCPVNGCIVEDRHRRSMNIAAMNHPGLHHGWLGQGQEIAEDGSVSGELAPNDTAGFWIVGVMSPFLLNGIGGLARELVKAEREFEVSGDPKTVKEVTVKQLGIPYTLTGPLGSVDATTLAERATAETYPLGGIPGGTWFKRCKENGSPPLGVVPEGVRFLTAWADVQVAHFEVLVRGWGEGAESWVIAKDRIPAETATDDSAWLALFRSLATIRFPLAVDPGRGMSVRAVGYDSQGAAGTWERATHCWQSLRKENLARSYGTLDGRDVWSVIPTQGASTRNPPRLQVVYPDNQRKDRKVALRGVVPVARFSPDAFKDTLAGQLHHMLPGPGFVHFPAGLRSKEPPHVNFEQLVAETRDLSGHWTKPHQGVRNEMLDLMVGNHVLAHLMGLARLNWQSPPSWAAPWDKNTGIGAIKAPGDDDKKGGAKQRALKDILG
jgi:phage terminase large subunit GpA-like protein